MAGQTRPQDAAPNRLQAGSIREPRSEARDLGDLAGGRAAEFVDRVEVGEAGFRQKIRSVVAGA